MPSPLPAQAITDHLVWAGDGSAWACFEVEPFGYPHRSARDAHDIHARTLGGLLALPHHSLILSVAHCLSSAELEARVRRSVDPDVVPAWTAHARRLAARIGTEPLHERKWFVAARLPEPGAVRGLVDGLRVAASAVAAILGIPHSPPGRTRVAAAMGVQAAQLEEQLAQHLKLRRLTAPQVRWVFERAVLRGLVGLPFPQPANAANRAATVRLDRDAVYFEGGRRDEPARPRHWRYLTVDHPDHGVAHQTFSCLGEIPSSWTFPYGSGEWLWHLDDQLPFPVDWAVRIERVGNEAARRRALRAKRNLVGQLEEPGGDPAGPITTLPAAAEAVEEHRSRLEANPALPAFRATTIVALAHHDIGVLERQATILESTFRAAEYNFYRPTGAQLECFTAMLPGSAAPRVVAEFAQDLLPDGLASAMPFAASCVGDPQGMLLGYSVDSLTRSPVFLDPGRAPRDLNRSGSLAAIGELGAGKSFLAKTLARNTLAMGGQVVAVDRTESAEYARLADATAGTSRVVEITDTASVSLDPFQVFDTNQLRLRYGVGFITLLTGTPPSSAAGIHCHQAAHRALQTAQESDQPARLTDVLDHLEPNAATQEVAEKLSALSRVPYGQLVLGDVGPPLDLDADYVAFLVPGLGLPRLGNTGGNLLPEELIGQAILYLLAAFSRRLLFRHSDRFAALLLDEAHALTANPQGRALIGDLIRDGRKHYAAVWAFSQLPTDLTSNDPDESLDALLGYRMAFRQSRRTAPAALEFVGSDPRPETIEAITSLATGECLMRDPEGRLGLVRISPPEDPTTAAAFSTTPLSEQLQAGPWASINPRPDAPVASSRPASQPEDLR